MMTVIAIVHIIVCLLLIALVLLQDPKSGGAGGVFGGGGANQLMSATGATTFLTRLTRYSAIVFGVTCLILTLMSRPNTSSVIDSVPTKSSAPVEQPQQAPAAPAGEQAPAGQPAAPQAK
jgi:preprotein translocase subunit SecG